MSRPFPSRSASPSSFVRVNGKIRAREVRCIGVDNQQLGILTLADAINQARAHGVDLVEIAPNATPPVCRMVDFGKYRYEMAKKEKESKKHQHANKVKEIQLSPGIDPHDFGVKLTRAIDFLCGDMKVKVTLKFRGREMAHKEFGFLQINKFIKDTELFGHPDFEPKLIGKGINLMLSPLPRNKRAKNPNLNPETDGDDAEEQEHDEAPAPKPPKQKAPVQNPAPTPAPEPEPGFNNNPFEQIEVKPEP